MKNKRFLAIFLVLTMLVSLMPVGFAAGEEEEVLADETELEEIVEEPAEEPVEEEEVYQCVIMNSKWTSSSSPKVRLQRHREKAIRCKRP